MNRMLLLMNKTAMAVGVSVLSMLVSTPIEAMHNRKSAAGAGYPPLPNNMSSAECLDQESISSGTADLGFGEIGKLVREENGQLAEDWHSDEPLQFRRLRKLLGNDRSFQLVCEFLKKRGGGDWLAYRMEAQKEATLDFIIDTSQSMNTQDGMRDLESNCQMSRIMELKARLSVIFRFISYFPVKKVVLRSFSYISSPIIVEFTGRSPDDIFQELQWYLDRISADYQGTFFGGGTPLKEALEAALASNPPGVDRKFIYIVSDGEPTDCTVQHLQEILCLRNADRYPLCLLPCTNDEDSISWMNELDVNKNVHVVDDPEAAREKIFNMQGSSFPVTESFLLLSSLLGGIDTFFGKANEKYIYTQAELNEIVGRKLSDEDYRMYKREALARQSCSCIIL